jgi:hypothetical protein
LAEVNLGTSSNKLTHKVYKLYKHEGDV